MMSYNTLKKNSLTYNIKSTYNIYVCIIFRENADPFIKRFYLKYNFSRKDLNYLK